MPSLDAQSIFDRHLPAKVSLQAEADCYAPSNIALSKYWGKRNKALNLPQNSSLSISLRDWGSRTKISASTTGDDSVSLNGKHLAPESPFARKLIGHVEAFRRDQTIPLRIETINTIPTAAGLASSASGFAALTLALDAAFGLELPKSTLSMLARIGSGSASRSLWHGFVEWSCGDEQDGSDSIAHPLDGVWPDFRIAIVPVDTGPKSQSSRDGMNHTTATSPLYKVWPDQAETDCAIIRNAVLEQDFETLGATAEANALAMHATMMAARPALIYLKPQSWQILDTVRDSRKKGHAIYATMDAGANVKLLFLSQDEAHVKEVFPTADIICPFEPLVP